MAKRKNKLFLLSWKKLWIVVGGIIASIILHNLISALLGLEEAAFFIITFVLILYLIVSVIYSLINKLKGGAKRKK